MEGKATKRKANMREDLTMIQCTKAARAMLKSQAANRGMTMTAYLEYVLELYISPTLILAPDAPPTWHKSGSGGV